MMERTNYESDPSESDYESDFQNEEESDHPKMTETFTRGYSIVNFDLRRPPKDIKREKMLKKFNDLKDIIKFEYSLEFEMINQSPIDNYDIFLSGLSSRAHIAIQTNEDEVDREIQTQSVDSEDLWTQHPSVFLGGGAFLVETEKKGSGLEKFVERAGKIMVAVLNEEKRHLWLKKSQKLKYFDESYKIKVPPQLKNKPCRQIKFVSSKVLLTVHNPNYICLWSISDPTSPQKILNCETTVESLTTSESTAEVFSGNTDGSILAWDLRSVPTQSAVKVYSISIPSVSPSYNTCFEVNGHLSPVVGVECVPISRGSDFAYQLVSAEKHGKINVWSVYKSEDDSLANFPGTRLKLFLNSSIETNLILFCLICHPKNISHHYVGTNIGPIYVKQERKSTEKFKANLPEPVVFIEFSPTLPDYFIMGTATGEIFLYNIDRPASLCSFDLLESRIVLLKWISGCPMLFVCVCENSEIYFFDLLGSLTSHVFHEKIDSKKVVHADLSRHGEEGQAVSLYLSLTFDDGEVKVFKFSSEVTKFAQKADDASICHKLQDCLIQQIY